MAPQSDTLSIVASTWARTWIATRNKKASLTVNSALKISSMGGELPDYVLQDVARDTDPPNRYDGRDSSNAATKFSSSQGGYASSEYIDPSLLFDPSFVDSSNVDYGVGPTLYSPFALQTRSFEDLQAHNFDNAITSTRIDGVLHGPFSWAELETRQDYYCQFLNLEPTADTRSDGTLHRRASSGSLRVEPDDSSPFGGDIYNLKLPGIQSQIDREAEATVPHVLVCNHGACRQTFTGAYRKGNLARHIKHNHRLVNSLYSCEAENCHGTFARQDARLKHYRKHHPHLASAALTRRGGPSDSTQKNSQEVAPRESDPRGIASIIEHDSSSYQDSTLENDKLSSSATSSHSYAPYGHLQLQEAVSTFDTEHSNATSDHNDDVQMIDDGRFACNLCENTFQRLTDLRRHTQKHEKPAHKCVVTGCGRDFYRMDKLRDHVRLAHKGDVITTFGGSLRFEVSAKPESIDQSFSCTHCSEVFQRKCDLNHHIYRRHERRYKCTVPHCTRSFHLNKDLQRHVTAQHSRRHDAQMFTCSNVGCNRTFSRRDNLLRHMRRCDQKHATSEVAEPVPASVSKPILDTATDEGEAG